MALPPERRLSRRAAGVQPSATATVDNRAKALRVAGRPVIGFGAGEPDFPTPQHVVDAAIVACGDPRNHRYTPAAGLPELREAVAATVTRDTGRRLEPEQTLITNGGKHAVSHAFAALLDPGDEVLLPSPYWTTFPEAIGLAGGRPVIVATDAEHGFLPTLEALEAARTSRTRALLWCSPSNPTGAVAARDLVEAVGRWAAEHRIWVICDELYDRLVYEGAEHASMPAAVPEITDRCLVLGGVAKTYAMTGWRVGWMLGPADVVAAAAAMQSHTTSNVANVSQQAALAAITGPDDVVHEMRDAFDRRRRLMSSVLSTLPGVRCPTPRGAFYAFASVHDLLGHDSSGQRPRTSAELAEQLLDRAEVAVVPGEAFGAPGHIRLSYALGDADIRTGLERVGDLLATWG